MTGHDGRSVEEIVGRARRGLLGRLAGAGTVWTAVLAAGVLAAAWIWVGEGGWARGSVAPLVLDAVLLAGVAGAVVGFRFLARTRFGESRVAGSLDRAAGLGDGTVYGSVELGRTLPAGVSPSLATRAGSRVAERLAGGGYGDGKTLDPAPRRWLGRGGAALLLLGGLTVFLGVRDPQRARAAWSGLAAPASVIAAPDLPPLEVRPASGELDRGTPLVVRVRAPGRERVELRWQFAGDVSRRRQAPVEDRVAAFRLGALTAPVELTAFAPDGARSEVVRITPRDPLLVTDLTLEVRYPPHTGRGTERFRREAPPLVLPVGSRIGIEGRASRTLSSVSLRPGGGAEGAGGVDLTVDGERFSGAWRPSRDGRYAWDVRDENDRVAAGLPAPVELTLVADSAPSVELLFPGRDTVLALDRRQPLVIRARDDHGLSSVELVAYRVSSFGEREEPVTRRLDPGGARAALARPVLDVSEWELLPGDTVRYRVRVVDNAPRPDTARTREYALRIPGAGEVSREVQERLEGTAEAVDSLAEEAGRAADEARELERRSVERRSREGAERTGAAARSSREAGSGESSFEAREEVQRAVERRGELMDRTDSLREELEGLERATEDAGLADPELSRDLEELRSLLEELSAAEDREALRDLRDRLESMDPEELSRALRSVSEEQGQFRERLEESLDRFRRAAADQDFRATAEQAREVAREQEALAEAMSEGDDPERRARQQERLRERAESLQEHMEDLEERVTRLGEHEARAGVQEARERSRSAEASMARASQSSRGGEPQEAGESGREAARTMQESADRLDRARNEMARRLEEELERTLQRTASEALALARRQSELREGMRGSGRRERAELRGDQAALLQGLRNLTGQVAGAAALAPGVGLSLAEAAGGAQEAMGRTLQALDDEASDGGAPSAAAEEAVGALNELALRASSSTREGGGQGQSGAAGGQQTLEQLQELARQQGSLLEQSGALSSMQLGQESLQGQLREMARGQGAVADELGELARQRRENPGEQVLGDLEALGEEARALAERLGGGRLDADTRRRQERLFHRLLDAGRSLENDEESRERESRTAGAVAAEAVEPLTEEALGGTRYGIPDGAALQALPPAQRAMVIRYFERLNRSSPPDDGARVPDRRPREEP